MSTSAVRGSIWTVPCIGKNALCVLLSDARGIARGRPEYQVVPLSAADPGFVHTEFDFRFAENETSLGAELYAALWNLRPVLQADLGELRGQVTSPTAMLDLRDAYLRLADPSIKVRRGRLGKSCPSDSEALRRAAIVKSWLPVSGRVLQEAQQPETALFSIKHEWSMFYLDQLESMSRKTCESERLIGETPLVAAGGGMGVVRVALSTLASFSEPVGTRMDFIFSSAQSAELPVGRKAYNTAEMTVVGTLGDAA